MLDIDGVYKEYTTALDSQVLKFKDMYNDPEVILIDLFHADNHQPYYNNLTEMLRSGGISHHDIQNELGKVLADYFKLIDPEVDVRVVNPNSYPSRFGIYYLEKELVSFNIYKHVFGMMSGDISEETYSVLIQNDTEILNEQVEKLKKYQQYCKNPFSCLSKENYTSKGIKRLLVQSRDFWYLLFHQKKVKEHIEKRVKSISSRISEIEKQINSYHKKIEQINEIKDPLKKKYRELRERFLKWGYEEKPPKDYSLY